MTTKQKVEMYLNVKIKTRDNDNFLCAVIWDNERYNKGITKIDFLVEFAKGVFTSAETIVRHRRKLQELHPELRGAKYNERKNKLEPEYREKFSPKNN